MFHFMKKERTAEEKEKRKREKRERKQQQQLQMLNQQLLSHNPHHQQLSPEELDRLQEVRKSLSNEKLGITADYRDHDTVRKSRP